MSLNKTFSSFLLVTKCLVTSGLLRKQQQQQQQQKTNKTTTKNNNNNNTHINLSLSYALCRDTTSHTTTFDIHIILRDNIYIF